MDQLTVVCWLFRGHGISSGGKPVTRDYTAAHVHRFAQLIDHWLMRPHRVLCITDQPETIDPQRCDILPQPARLAPFPKAFRKLWVFSPQFTAAVGAGSHIFVSDIDVAIVGPLDSLVDRHENLVVWHDPGAKHTRYSSGNYLFSAGAWPALWDTFSLDAVPRMRQVMTETYGRATGSDMCWMSYSLTGHDATFGPGIYRAKYIGANLPPDARIVHFSGVLKPWHAKAQALYPWLKGHD